VFSPQGNQCGGQPKTWVSASHNKIQINREEKMARSLRDLYVEELRDLYSAEHQIIKALPKIAKRASAEELRSAFEDHLEQTKGQVERLEKVFDSLDEKPKGKKCVGMEGLLEEGAEIMEQDFEDGVMDAALISAAQRVEHYEIAAYGTACAFAEQLGESQQASLLRETLQEEKETDHKLTELSSDINSVALQAEPARGRHEVGGRRSRRAA
jgi:ferritin-like metal-binding protein YciE